MSAWSVDLTTDTVTVERREGVPQGRHVLREGRPCREERPDPRALGHGRPGQPHDLQRVPAHRHDVTVASSASTDRVRVETSSASQSDTAILTYPTTAQAPLTRRLGHRARATQDSGASVARAGSRTSSAAPFRMPTRSAWRTRRPNPTWARSRSWTARRTGSPDP
ncbi:hypothetical protein ACFUAG_12295 [Streptomyces sp. NPDC057193]|uniref:hypothetical protein n=1 Tax=Streptomyces sp. NPDC057193 TaxID=3346043 RepID=UPI00362C8C71